VVESERVKTPIHFTEDAVTYALHRSFGTDSRLFFKFHHNLTLQDKRNRSWYFYCAPEVDVIEVRGDGHVIAYELKGARRHHSGIPDYPAIYDAIGQAIAYLDLPWVYEGDTRKFDGGVFDEVYVVCARENSTVGESELRILSTVPVGAMLALPDGRFVTIKPAPQNPIQDVRAKEFFLQHLDCMEKHTNVSRIFRRIAAAGEEWFAANLVPSG
jgi:hypothetical protein